MVDSLDTLDLPKLSFRSFSAAPPRRPRHVTPLSAVQLAYTGLITELARHTPHVIVGNVADRFDILERGEHLKAVLAAVTSYVKAVVSDTDYYAQTTIHDETAGLADSATEIVGAFLNANDRLQDLEAEAAE